MSGTRGATLVETLVAITLLAVGLVAQSGGLILAERLAHDGRQRTHRAAMLTSRAELEWSLGDCETRHGSTTTGGVELSWRVDAPGQRPGVARFTISVRQQPLRGRSAADTLLSARWCAP